MLYPAANYEIRPWLEEVLISVENCCNSLQRCHDGDFRFRFVFTDYDKDFS